MSVFLDAIKVLEERGWHQGDWTDGPYEGDGAVCLLGAVAVAKGLKEFCDLQDDAYQECLFLGRLTEPHPERYDFAFDAAAAWNDDESTSYEDVVLLLKRAHEAWESR